MLWDDTNNVWISTNNEVKIEKYMRIASILSVVISVIISLIIRMSGSNVSSAWKLVLYAGIISIGLLIANYFIWKHVKSLIAEEIKQKELENKHRYIDMAKMSIDKSNSVYDEINSNTLYSLWEGEDKYTIEQWDYEGRKQKAEKWLSEIYHDAEVKGNETSNKYKKEGIVTNIIYSILFLTINACCFVFIGGNSNVPSFLPVAVIVGIITAIVGAIFYCLVKDEFFDFFP